MTDLSQSFNKLVSEMYENIQGVLCEKLPDGKYRWGSTTGTRSEIERAIKDAGANIQNSLNKST